jgi:hypothetical protein
MATSAVVGRGVQLVDSHGCRDDGQVLAHMK